MTKEQQAELIEKARTSLSFLSWDIDEFVEPDFGDDEEQQTTFERMYGEMFENFQNLINELHRITQ